VPNCGLHCAPLIDALRMNAAHATFVAASAALGDLLFGFDSAVINGRRATLALTGLGFALMAVVFVQRWVRGTCGRALEDM
jgi:hypothetical protein